MTTRKGIIPASVCIPVCISTQDRWQSKTLLTIDELGTKIARNSVFGCHLSPVGRQMAIENSVSNNFLSMYRQ